MCWLIMLMMNGKIHFSPTQEGGLAMAVSASCFQCTECVLPHYRMLRCGWVMWFSSSSSCSLNAIAPSQQTNYCSASLKILCCKSGLNKTGPPSHFRICLWVSPASLCWWKCFIHHGRNTYIQIYSTVQKSQARVKKYKVWNAFKNIKCRSLFLSLYKMQSIQCF